MKIALRCIPLLGLVAALGLSGVPAWGETAITLPAPRLSGKLSVEAAMVGKKSVREYANKPVTLAEAGQMLWATNGDIPVDGVTQATRKTIASAGGIYPLQVFLVVGKGTVGDLPEGVYQYTPSNHSITRIAGDDRRSTLAAASLGQFWMATAPAIVVIGAEFDKTMMKYRQMGFQFLCMEAGAADQNLYLQSASLGLRMATVGAFAVDLVKARLGLPDKVTPLILAPFGK